MIQPPQFFFQSLKIVLLRGICTFSTIYESYYFGDRTKKLNNLTDTNNFSIGQDVLEWEYRFARLMQELQQHNCDVICLQEV